MSRAFVKDASDQRWQPVQSSNAEFAVYLGRNTHSFDPEPVRRGDDFAELLHWAFTQPRGSYVVRDRSGRRLAEITGRD